MHPPFFCILIIPGLEHDMLKRKYGDRSDWKRITQRKFAKVFLETNEYTGYITLLQLTELTSPLIVQYEKKCVCIADKEYTWLQQFPKDARHSVTTMFDAEGRIVQWYIDICLGNGCDDGRPWMDDLYIDLILFPSGEIFVKDTDELEAAYKSRIIHKELYDLAWKEAGRVKSLLCTGNFPLVDLASEHRNLLIGLLE